jgi:putative endonuclease
MGRQYYVYIMTNPRRTVLYTGITNNLLKRVWQHRNGEGGGFTRRYHCSKLVL